MITPLLLIAKGWVAAGGPKGASAFVSTFRR
jgi:hypothetical protein